MGYERVKTEHAGAKNGGGAWMTRAQAERAARHKRRALDMHLGRAMRATDPQGARPGKPTRPQAI